MKGGEARGGCDTDGGRKTLVRTGDVATPPVGVDCDEDDVELDELEDANLMNGMMRLLGRKRPRDDRAGGARACLTSSSVREQVYRANVGRPRSRGGIAGEDKGTVKCVRPWARPCGSTTAGEEGGGRGTREGATLALQRVGSPLGRTQKSVPDVIGWEGTVLRTQAASLGSR